MPRTPVDAETAVATSICQSESPSYALHSRQLEETDFEWTAKYDVSTFKQAM